MAVSFGVLCSSTRTANYELLIMMPSDNYYMNQDGVVHHDYLCFIMCRYSLCIRYYVLFVIVTICWSVPCSIVTYVYNHLCLRDCISCYMLHVF